ncbi:P-type conjugative transfer protein TrbG [Megalodesulfovibrio paquesii]
MSPKEKKALSLVHSHAAQGPAPFQDGSGRLVFVHGASVPTIVTAPLHVCDVELQPGEALHEVVVGDSARWLMDVAKAGTGDNATVHLLVKPVDAGLETSAVVTTSRRVYHLRLVSQRQEDGGFMPYVGFAYRDDHIRRFAEQQAREEKQRHWQTTPAGADLGALNFGYVVKGKASWKPAQVYDDGRQTFIRLPEAVASAGIPVLLVREADADVLVNYRVKDRTIIMDGVFPRVVLVSGVGSQQKKVEIRREDS